MNTTSLPESPADRSGGPPDAAPSNQPGWVEAPGLGHYIVVGALVGVTLSFAFVTGGALALHQKWQSAVGLAAFTSFWGGLGFGSMVAGVVYLTHAEQGRV